MRTETGRNHKYDLQGLARDFPGQKCFPSKGFDGKAQAFGHDIQEFSGTGSVSKEISNQFRLQPVAMMQSYAIPWIRSLAAVMGSKPVSA